MAISQIPPVGSMANSLKRQEMLRREMETSDPLERYRLREERIQNGFNELSGVLIRQAKNNAKIYQAIIESDKKYP